VKVPPFIRKSIPVMLVLLLVGTAFADSGKGRGHISDEKWKSWIGEKVDVDYTACDHQGCVLVRNAELKEVKDKAIVVIVKGSQFYIPKYMITRVALSKEQGQKLK
jgi:ribosome maturation factor RimP